MTSSSQTPKLDELWRVLFRYVDSELDHYPRLRKSINTLGRGKQPAYIVIVACTIIIALIVVGLIGHNGVTAIVCIYPLYRTLVVMKCATQIASQNDPDDKQRWLTFWLVFGVLTYCDPVIRFILGFVPLYYLLKLALYVSFMHPKIDLAMQFYTSFIKPRITKVEPVRKEP